MLHKQNQPVILVSSLWTEYSIPITWVSILGILFLFKRIEHASCSGCQGFFKGGLNS